MPLIRPLAARDPHEAHRASTPLELFFDLVAVIAIAASTAGLHHAISEGHGLEVLPRFAFLFVAIWWSWMNFTWFASAFDNDDGLYRVTTGVIMAGFLLFAAGAEHILATLDFRYGLLGWIVMRLGMIAHWLRAASADPGLKRTAVTYAIGIGIAQLGWTALYFSTAPGSGAFVGFSFAVWAIEFAVPVLAERAAPTPWHRHHIIERYGLLTIIVLGEVLLSMGLMLGPLYEGPFNIALVVGAASGLVIVFVLWWIYFLDGEHLESERLPRALLWGYGHIFVFAGGAMVGAGLGAAMDVVTHHAHIAAGQAAAWVDAGVALYLGVLWLIRDLFNAPGAARAVLPLAVIGFAALGWAGMPLVTTAALAIATLVLRLRLA